MFAQPPQGEKRRANKVDGDNDNGVFQVVVPICRDDINYPYNGRNDKHPGHHRPHTEAAQRSVYTHLPSNLDEICPSLSPN
jgi:hypothetical protein